MDTPVPTRSVQSSASPEQPPVPTSALPLPHPDFFRSTFFRQFSLKRKSSEPQLHIADLSINFISRILCPDPIFDPTDFQFLHSGNTQFDVVSIERQVLAMVLVAWAASFGLNERGAAADPAAPRYAGLYDVRLEGDGHAMRTDALVSGILSLVDTHGLLRNPTWDGVRLLLLLWPLTQRVQRSLERIVCLLSITYSALTVI